MLTPKQIRKLVEKIIDNKIIDYPTSATIAVIDGNLADIQLPGRTTHMRNCRIVGDPNQIAIGQVVGLTWENDHGSMRPVVYAPGGGGGGENRILFSVGGSSGGGTVTDGITIENSATQGLRVKKAGISLEHLSFIPALSDHQHGIGEILPGWEVSNDGIIFSDQVSISPLGTITLGRDPDIVKLGVEDATYRIWAGNSDPASAPFSVSKTGALVSSSATIAGWTINATQIKKTGIILDSSTDQIIVGDGAPRIYIDGDKRMIESEGFTTGFTGFGLFATNGDAEFNNVVVRGTIRASVFNVGEITATAGTSGTWLSAAELYETVTIPAVALTVVIKCKNSDFAPGAALFALGDVLRVKAWDGSSIVDVWGEIELVTPFTGYTSYLTRIKSGGTVDLPKGVAVVDYGQSLDGFITMSADGTMGASANLSIADVRKNYVATTVLTNGGNGYAVGDQFRILDTGSSSDGGNGALVTVLTVASGPPGPVATYSVGDPGWDYTVGVKSTWGAGNNLCTIEVLTVEGPWTQTWLKARIGNMYGSYGAGGINRYGFGIGDYDAGNYMSYNAEAWGSFVMRAGDGTIRIDASGIGIEVDTTLNTTSAVRFTAGSAKTGALQSYQNAGTHLVRLSAWGEGDGAGSGRDGVIQIEASGDTGKTASVWLAAGGETISLSTSASSTGVSIGGGLWVTGNMGNQSGSMYIRGYAAPPLGVGGELAYTSGTFRIWGYNRATPGDLPVMIRGSAVEINESGTSRFKFDSGHLYRNTGGYKRVSTVVYISKVAVSGWAGTGRSSSTGTFTEANLGIPENATGVLVRIIAKDSGTWPKDLYFAVGPTASDLALAAYPPGKAPDGGSGVELFAGATAFVGLSGGTLNWAIAASGASTMDCWVQVFGYSM